MNKYCNDVWIRFYLYLFIYKLLLLHIKEMKDTTKKIQTEILKIVCNKRENYASHFPGFQRKIISNYKSWTDLCLNSTSQCSPFPTEN